MALIERNPRHPVFLKQSVVVHNLKNVFTSRESPSKLCSCRMQLFPREQLVSQDRHSMQRVADINWPVLENVPWRLRWLCWAVVLSGPWACDPSGLLSAGWCAWCSSRWTWTQRGLKIFNEIPAGCRLRMITFELRWHCSHDVILEALWDFTFLCVPSAGS